MSILSGVVGVVVGVALAACGRSVPAPTPPAPSVPRIVALSPAAAIILRDLGEEPNIVGRHAFDLMLDPALPSCGDQNTIDLEALSRIAPTHIITQWQSRDLPAPFRELAAKQGWKTYDSNLLSLDDIDREVDQLSAFLGLAPDGKARDLHGRLRAALRPRGPNGGQFRGAGRVLLLGGVSPPGALGPGSCHHQVLERIGGSPALISGNAWVELDAEDVLRLAPDSIIAVLPRDPRKAPRARGSAVLLGEAALARVASLRSLAVPAVTHGRIAVIDDPYALTPSTAMAGFADELAEVLSAWESP